MFNFSTTVGILHLEIKKNWVVIQRIKMETFLLFSTTAIKSFLDRLQCLRYWAGIVHMKRKQWCPLISDVNEKIAYAHLLKSSMDRTQFLCERSSILQLERKNVCIFLDTEDGKMLQICATDHDCAAYCISEENNPLLDRPQFLGREQTYFMYNFKKCV